MSGLDIVREQFRLAAGEPLSAGALAAAERAADPGRPRHRGPPVRRGPGPRLRAGARAGSDRWVMPAGPGVRVDTGLEAGDRVPPDYDNLIAKVMVHAGDRDAAIDRLRRALDETEVAGIQTTLPFHRFVARHAGFRAGDLSTDWVGEDWDGAGRASAPRPAAAEAAAAAVAAARSRTAGSRPARRRGPRRSRRLGEPPARADADRPVAAMSRAPRSRDRATGEVVAELDRPTRRRVALRHADRAPRPIPSRGERPIVLPAARPSTARGRRALEVVVDGWRFELEVEDADLADLRERATSQPRGGRPSRTDRGSCHHPGAGRVRGRRRRATRSRPASGSSWWRR